MTAEKNLLDLAQTRITDTVSKWTVLHISPWSEPYRFNFLSVTARLVLGYDEFELLNSEKSWMQRIYPGDVPNIYKLISNLNENESISLRYRFLSKSGVFQILQDSIRVIRSKRDNALYLVGCWTQVKNGQQNDEQVSGDYYDFLINRSTARKYRFTVDQSDREIELAVCENRSPSETQTDSTNSQCSASQMQYKPIINSILSGARTIDVETNLATEQGQYFRVNGECPNRYQNEIPPTDYYVPRNVGDRGETWRSLARQNRHYRLMLNAIGEGVLALDVVGKITFVNPAGLKLLGWTKDELIGQSVYKILQRSKASGSSGSNQEFPACVDFSCGEPRSASNQVIWRKNNTAFPVDYKSTPIRNEAHQLITVNLFSPLSL